MAATSILDLIAQATRLREGSSGVAALLRAVYRAGSMKLQDAAREARLPLPVATAVRRELEKAGMLERRHGLTLTGDGREFVERDLGMKTQIDITCAACSGHGIVIPEQLQGEVERLAEIVKRAPSVDVTLDQAPCSPDTAIRRALLMLQNGALEGKRVLLLGDDDSVSIAIGLVGARAAARRLDPWRHRDRRRRAAAVVLARGRRARTTGAANRASRSASSAAGEFAACVRRHRDRPALYAGRSKTVPGARLRGAVGGTPTVIASSRLPIGRPRRCSTCKKSSSSSGWRCRAVWPDFNRYAGASVLGNLGQLIELVHAGEAAAELPDFSGALYTAEVNPRLRLYACADCGKEISLGQDGVPATIDEAKVLGCRKCGGHVFRRQSGRP